MSTQLENPPFDDSFFQQSLPQVYRSILSSFRKIATSTVRFNATFAALFLFELCALFLCMPITNSVLLALSLSCLFLTVFSYFALLVYFMAKKPEQFLQLKEKFLSSAGNLHSSAEAHTERHLSIASALHKLAAYLGGFESNLYQIPPFLAPLSKALQSFSSFCHSHDVLYFKQLLLHAAIEEHLYQIRATPTDLEVHASLANTYVSLSKLYAEPKQSSLSRCYRKRRDAFEENFRTAASLAIEEFQILNHYAPNDPWVHEQLAAGYRDLGMPDEEIHEVELLLKLKPHDKELLLRLGVLYFQQKSNAKGLRVYEELKQSHYKKAQDLIAEYGKPQSCEII